MKNGLVFLAMAVLAVSAVADFGVLPSTYHESDAELVYYLVSACGFSDCWVSITQTIGTLDIDYYVGFDGYNSNGSFERWIAAIMSVAAVSEQTTWTSAKVCVGFRDNIFVTPTSCARFMRNNYSTRTDEQWLLYLDANTTIIPR